MRLPATVVLGLRLSWGSPDQRLRSLLVSVACAVGTVLLLVAWTVAYVRLHDQSSYAAETDRLLAAIVAAVALPVVVLAGTVGRLSAALRDRRLANLRLLGLSPGQTRQVAAAEAGVAGLSGTLAGMLVALAARPLLPDPDRALVGAAGGPGWAAYAVVLVGLPVVTVAAAVLPPRLDPARALARARSVDVKRPSLLRALPLLAGIVVCILTGRAADTDAVTGTVTGTVTAGLFGGIALVGLGLVAVAPVFVRLLADLLLRLGRGPTALLAARRMQSQPAGASRVVAALMVGLFLVTGARAVVVAFESTTQYLAATDALEHPQVLTLRDPDAPGTAAADALTTPGVRDALTAPVVQVQLPGDEAGFDALVATCAELASLVEDLDDCREGQARWLDLGYAAGPGSTSATTLRVRAQVDGAPQSAAVEVGPPTRPDGAITEERDRNALQFGLLLPPSDPGVASLLRQTDRTVLVTTDPGRAAFDALTASDLRFSSSVDFAELDFVAALRTAVWSLAAVIVSIGLLTFTIAAIDRTLTRRREIVGLRLLGTPPGLLRRAQWLEAALPTALGCALAVVAGLFAGSTYLSLDPDGQGAPWRQSLGLMLAAVVASVLVATLTVIATNTRLDPDHIRAE